MKGPCKTCKIQGTEKCAANKNCKEYTEYVRGKYLEDIKFYKG